MAATNPSSNSTLNFLEAAEAIRLYHTVSTKLPITMNIDRKLSHNICRICRNSSGNLTATPCKCHGTMGFIHEKCLQRWTRRRRSDVCEICKEKYRFEKLNSRYFSSMMYRFFMKRNNFPLILKKIITTSLLIPLIHVASREFTDVRIQDIETNLWLQTFLPSFLLLKGLFFYEFMKWTSRCACDIKYILHNWWNYSWLTDLSDISDENSLDVNIDDNEFIEDELFLNTNMDIFPF